MKDSHGKILSNKIVELVERMLLIREFEENVLELFNQGKIYGTTHTSIGQEAIAVAALSNITENDHVFSNHRCHGHYIAYGGDIKLFFAELMGKKSGVVGGRGGSQHIRYRNFFTNGVQGGIVGNATGIALSKKIKKQEGVVYCFMGDGTLGQGLSYESFNFASLKSLPIIYIIENNQYAMSTKYTDAVAGSIRQRTEAFGIRTLETNSSDIFELIEIFGEAKAILELDPQPVAVVANTYRLSPHSKGDEIRSHEELSYYKNTDPINQVPIILGESNFVELSKKVKQLVKEAIITAEEDEQAEIDLLFSSDYLPNINSENNYLIHRQEQFTVRDRINLALDDLLSADENVFLIGEDLADPYGGAFKVTKGLSQKYPNKVINTPISEAGIAAWAIGAALNSSKPIAEIMFGDFITMILDQLINHASKYIGVYRMKEGLPLIIRTPMGGKRGYGATHSQSLEKLLIGIPNLIVVALNNILDPHVIYKNLSSIKLPVVVVENKLLYSKKMVVIDSNDDYFESFKLTTSNDFIPIVKFTYDQSSIPVVTLIAFGEMISDCLETAKYFMMEHEILINVLAISQLNPIQTESIADLSESTDYIVTVEEGTENGNWGETLISKLLSLNKGNLNYLSLSSLDHVIPIEKNFENRVLVGYKEIVNRLESILL
jgi:2-oxoisovalerate dehydrogenase E1 component